MCIALVTTAHPDYALIVIDNRDEFILRPTSLPHWWNPPIPASTSTSTLASAHNTPTAQQILSSRDLQRAEHGTWLGITRGGNFAVLTNFREDDSHDRHHPVHGQRSRGGMVTAWLTADPHESTEAFVSRLLAGAGVKGVGGFSLICGKLRRQNGHGQGNGNANLSKDTATATPKATTTPSIKPLAIISNRSDEFASIPWIAGQRSAVYGLSNTQYDDPDVWPKVRDGKAALAAVCERPTTSEESLRDDLFAILDRDTLPDRPGLSFEDQIPLLKHTIFVPPIGDEDHREAMHRSTSCGPRTAVATADEIERADVALAAEETPDEQTSGFMTGLYGTQRQTVLLVDWQGRVSYTERALYDANGIPIPRGKGDVHFEFQIEGWDEEDESA